MFQNGNKKEPVAYLMVRISFNYFIERNVKFGAIVSTVTAQ